MFSPAPNEFGKPAEVAAQIVARYSGKADRISPVVYQPDLALLEILRREITAADESR